VEVNSTICRVTFKIWNVGTTREKWSQIFKKTFKIDVCYELSLDHQWHRVLPVLHSLNTTDQQTLCLVAFC